MTNYLRVLGKILYYILVEVFGTVLLVFFLSLLMDLHMILTFIPWIIALSSAAAGFCVRERGLAPLKRQHLVAVGTGIAAVLLIYGVLNVIFFFFSGEYQLSGWNFLTFLVIGSGCSELGALLAGRHARSEKWGLPQTENKRRKK